MKKLSADGKMMMKIIYISDKDKDSFFIKSNKKNFNNGNVVICNGPEAAAVIESEKPNLVLFDFLESVNGNKDMIDMLRGLDIDNRLRVSIIKFNPSYKKTVDSIKNLLHIFSSYKKKREAFVRR